MEGEGEGDHNLNLETNRAQAASQTGLQCQLALETMNEENWRQLNHWCDDGERCRSSSMMPRNAH